MTINKQIRTLSTALMLAILLWGCQKKETTYVYQVDDVEVNKPASEKSNVKSQTEFIAIAYADLTGNNISSTALEDLLAPYRAFGDQKLIEQMIIKSFLNNPNIDIPTKTEMLADVDVFITDAYKRFYNREPDEFELWQMKSFIGDGSGVEPQLVYYAIMTSDEYRYY